MSDVKPSWWWNDNDTPEDKALLMLIRIIEKLGHLPTENDVQDSSEIAEIKRTCITYFGSFGGGCRKAAKLLYGHQDLTSPDDLLPAELELSQDEQAIILAERRRNYQQKVQELKVPGTLGRWRREASRKQFEMQVPKGCVVKRIPTRTARELREEREKALCKTKGLFVPTDAPVRKPVSSAKRQHGKSSLREEWERSQRQQEETRRRAQQAQAQKAQQNQLLAQTQPAQNNLSKGREEMGGPRRSKDELLQMLYDLSKRMGRIPSLTQLRLYSDMHDGRKLPSATTFLKALGGKDTWAQQLEDYARIRGLDSLFAEPDVPAPTPDTAPKPDDAKPDEQADGDQTSAAPDVPASDFAPVPDASLGGGDVSDAPEADTEPSAPAADDNMASAEDGTTLPAEEVPTEDDEPRQDEPEQEVSMEEDEPEQEVDGPEPEPNAQPEQFKTESESQPEQTAQEAAQRTVIKINLTGVTLRFQLGGQDYELQIGI